jgi:hypothetical protein
MEALTAPPSSGDPRPAGHPEEIAGPIAFRSDLSAYLRAECPGERGAVMVS